MISSQPQQARRPFVLVFAVVSTVVIGATAGAYLVMGGRSAGSAVTETRSTTSERFPAFVLIRTQWDFFHQREHASQSAFEKAVRQHNQEGLEDTPDMRVEDLWQPRQIVLRSPRVIIAYFSDPSSEETRHHRVELSSENGEFFTAGELLFKLHNVAVSQLRESGHRYFEGLHFSEITADGIPVFELRQGS